MSEFSESYHLRTENKQDAINLLKRAALKGYVYEPTGGWVTFLAEENRFEPDPRITAANQRLLLHYVNAEDHGWSATLYQGNTITSAYRCDWEDVIQAETGEYSREAFLPLIVSGRENLFAEFEGQLRPTDFDELFDAEPAMKLAESLGLSNYSWNSHSYVTNSLEVPEEAEHLEVTIVD